MALTVFTEVAGTAYRLSSARFEVTATPAAGAAPVTLSTADSPTALALQEVLPPGEYNVALQAGWVLERQAAVVGTSDFMASKRAAANYFLSVVVPEALGLGAAAEIGAEPLYAFRAEALA